MSKYTRKSKDKDGLKKPDEFVSFWEKAYAAAAPYGRAIGYVLAGAVVVLLGAWAIDHRMSSSKQSTTEAFDDAVRIAEAELLPEAEPKKPDADKTPRFKTAKERGEAALAAFDKLEKEHGGQGATRRAQLVKAGLLYDLGRFADGEAAYRKFLEQAGDDDALAPLAREGVGLCQESQNKLDEALATYKALEPKSGDFYRDHALFDQARVLLRKGDKKGAEQAWKDLLTKVPQSPLKDDAQGRLGFLGVTPPPSPTVPGGPGAFTISPPG